jgi:anoctamin-10
MFSTVVIPFSGIYIYIAKALANFENHRTDQEFENSMTQKIFVLNFFTGYMSLFLTSYVYGTPRTTRVNPVPFGNYILPKLDVFHMFLPNSVDVKDSTPRTVSINPFRLRYQLIYFAVTAQIVGFAVENFLPYFQRKFFSEARKIANKDEIAVSAFDKDEEKVYLERVRNQAELPEFNLYTEYAEMVLQVRPPPIKLIQYGYVSLWSIIWPISPLCAVLNNWLELRSDAVKLCLTLRRPVPQRADSIGPWQNNINFLSWLGSLTTGSLAALFRGGILPPTCDQRTLITMLLTLLVAEHGYLIGDIALASLSRRIPTQGEIDVQREEYTIRRRYLAELVGRDRRDMQRVDPEPEGSFWGNGVIDGTVTGARELLSRSWEDKKVQ